MVKVRIDSEFETRTGPESNPVKKFTIKGERFTVTENGKTFVVAEFKVTQVEE